MIWKKEIQYTPIIKHKICFQSNFFVIQYTILYIPTKDKQVSLSHKSATIFRGEMYISLYRRTIFFGDADFFNG